MPPGMDVDGNGTVDLDEWLFGALSVFVGGGAGGGSGFTIMTLQWKGERT